ncbi:hypothetical protein Srubr_19600 [Streptomyces rubradiris]|uniref:Uncharacterized protein n=1 Tax=Streptomyces rubradiris TaxID=285531 RepID=A0ABQ3R8E7_STRRR|nr:hypothetical protein GCM10018792_59340 [Streptomyces rubradiris]GHI52114.1 hypothetical protein Srubr_19600 [Streptomyces rubradiris]
MTADLPALYPRRTEDQAVLRPLTATGPPRPYERARLAADAARTDWAAVPGRIPSPCLLPRRPRPRPSRIGLKAGRVPEQGTGVVTVEQTRRTLEAVAALDKPQAPGAGDPRGWQPVQKRPRKPKSKAAKKAALRRQRGRLKAAGRCRLAAGAGGTGSVALPSAAMPVPCPGCGIEPLAVVTMPGGCPPGPSWPKTGARPAGVFSSEPVQGRARRGVRTPIRG